MLYAKIEDRGHAPWLDEPAALSTIKDWLEDCQ
jgi:hypothetical protein